MFQQGKFRPVEEKVFNECVNTVVSYLPAVKVQEKPEKVTFLIVFFKDILLNSSRTRVGFLRMEMIDFIAGLINARCAKVKKSKVTIFSFFPSFSFFFAGGRGVAFSGRAVGSGGFAV